MTRKKTIAPIAEDGPTIYIGPTLWKWPLKQYTSFIGGVLPGNSPRSDMIFESSFLYLLNVAGGMRPFNSDHMAFIPILIAIFTE